MLVKQKPVVYLKRQYLENVVNKRFVDFFVNNVIALRRALNMWKRYYRSTGTSGLNAIIWHFYGTLANT